MRYEITLNGKVYEVEVEDNRALLGAIESARPLSDEELAEHPALARRMVSNITRAAAGRQPGPAPTQRPASAAGPRPATAGRPATAVRRPAPTGAPTTAPTAGPAAPRVAAAGEPVPAPMPGLIKDIKVQAGQRVKAGQVLVILEAMKMENEIVSPGEATVTEVAVSKGQTVGAGATLLKLAK